MKSETKSRGAKGKMARMKASGGGVNTGKGGYGERQYEKRRIEENAPLDHQEDSANGGEEMRRLGKDVDMEEPHDRKRNKGERKRGGRKGWNTPGISAEEGGIEGGVGEGGRNGGCEKVEKGIGYWRVRTDTERMERYTKNNTQEEQKNETERERELATLINSEVTVEREEERKQQEKGVGMREWIRTNKDTDERKGEISDWVSSEEIGDESEERRQQDKGGDRRGWVETNKDTNKRKGEIQDWTKSEVIGDGRDEKKGQGKGMGRRQRVRMNNDTDERKGETNDWGPPSELTKEDTDLKKGEMDERKGKDTDERKGDGTDERKGETNDWNPPSGLTKEEMIEHRGVEEGWKCGDEEEERRAGCPGAEVSIGRGECRKGKKVATGRDCTNDIITRAECEVKKESRSGNLTTLGMTTNEEQPMSGADATGRRKRTNKESYAIKDKKNITICGMTCKNATQAERGGPVTRSRSRVQKAPNPYI